MNIVSDEIIHDRHAALHRKRRHAQERDAAGGDAVLGDLGGAATAAPTALLQGLRALLESVST
jgi:hypothetical protein